MTTNKKSIVVTVLESKMSQLNTDLHNLNLQRQSTQASLMAIDSKIEEIIYFLQELGIAVSNLTGVKS